MHPVQERVEICNACGATDQKELHHMPAGFYAHHAYTTYPWDGAQQASFTIVQCKACGLIFQNPRFKSEHLGLLYTDRVEETVDMEKELARHKFQPLLDLIHQHVQTSSSNPLSLDIGTRFGLLPALLRRHGFDAHGIEYNPLCVELASRSGFEQVHQGTVDSLDEVMRAIGKDRIHLVTMTDVIEHLLDPMSDLTSLARFQSAGDCMVIQTVDIGSWGYRLFGKWWYHLHAQHTYYFDEAMLRRYFNALGYDITAVLKVRRLNNLTILPKVWRAFKQHQKDRNRLNAEGELQKKKWFAEGRPTLFDIITVVAKKRG
jgi:2-polyprenyl-3-methyl-5-hydroxy-6-metoxy-1,4-benzoquinol methylase